MKVKRLKRLNPRHSTDFEDFRTMMSQVDQDKSQPPKQYGKRVEIQELYVGKKNIVVTSQIRNLELDENTKERILKTSKKLFCWGCSSCGELGVDFLKEEYVSGSAQEISVEGITKNADTDKLIVGFSNSKNQNKLDNYIIRQVKNMTSDKMGSSFQNAEMKIRTVKDETQMIGKIACGDNQTLIVINDILYSIGKKTQEEMSTLPLIMTLSTNIQVKGMACGYYHSALFDFNGYTYTWGSTSFGKLGHPNQFGVFKEGDYEYKPRKVLSLDNMKVIGIALGETYSLFLNSKGEIYLVGKMNPVRNEVNYDMDYIRPYKCDPISKNKKIWMVKVKSGRKHAACVDRDGKLYTFGENKDGCLGSEEYSALVNPKVITELSINEQKVVDFDCGDYFTTVIIEAGNVNFDAQIYRDFKYDSNQKIIRRIFYEGKKNNLEPDQTVYLGDDEITKYPLPGQNLEENSQLEYGTIPTSHIQSVVLRKQTAFQFHKAILPVNRLSEKVTIETLVPTVKQFFGVINFTELPVQLLQTSESKRRKNLKQAIHETVNEMVAHSPDFKTFMNNFEKVVKLEGLEHGFEEIFFKEILKDPVIKKVVGKNIKRQKEDKVFIYGARRRRNQLYAAAMKSTHSDDDELLHSQENLLEDVYRDGLTVQTFNDWKSSINKNSIINQSKKEMFDPIRGIVERRYAPYDPSRCKYKYLGPVTNPISDINSYKTQSTLPVKVKRVKTQARIKTGKSYKYKKSKGRTSKSIPRFLHKRMKNFDVEFGESDNEDIQSSESDFLQTLDQLDKEKEDPYNPETVVTTTARHRLTQSTSKLSHIRIKRVKSSQIAKRRYIKATNESNKRMEELKNKRINEMRLQVDQKNIQLQVNRKRARMVKKKQKKELHQKLFKKYNKKTELSHLNSKEMLNKQKMINFRNWQNVWIRNLTYVSIFNQISLLIPVLQDIKITSFREMVSAKKIQSAWSEYLVLKGIKKLNLRQKFLLYYLGKKMKQKARIIALQKALKKISNTVLLDSSIKKKMRLGIGRFRAKTQE